MTAARVFVKRFADTARCSAAARHHAWLAAYAQPLKQPCLMQVGERSLTFQHIAGRHAGPADLPALAAMLGDAHGAAWNSTLRSARLDRPHSMTGGVLTDYVTCRQKALRKRLADGYLPNSAALDEALELLHRSADGPVAFYKDTNPRNVLLTSTGTAYHVDPDDLTLAPFGYDLAKLVVTLAMTYGPVRPDAVSAALTRYNLAAARHDDRLAHTSHETFRGFVTLHRVLTAPYAGRGSYRYPDLPHPEDLP